MTTTAPPIVPYVLAYSEELVPQRLTFREHRPSGGPRLEFVDPRRSDWVDGVLRARVRTHQRGSVRWKRLNTRRQWECLAKGWCQVCKRPAAQSDGRLPWLLTERVYQPIGEDRLGTTAPPTCRDCIPLSLQMCPQLSSAPLLCTVAAAEPVGVLGDLFRDGPDGEAIEAQRNVYVGWDEFARLTDVLAKLAVVELRDMRPEPLP
ncbi:hypothetical protein GCM10009530_63020 [Microbispora corallina]|uniref:Uncharacterized protein n=1 Tax=Microbispora corallina TaxID=83302 RepID=A0ABQ4GCK1_9ACTN|nr:hypothetical protein [Microbispora corallina]GIH44802.1 hypothetical protein Mco01_78020 [Microbispora corallina]